MSYGLYNYRHPSLIIAFHGCDESIAQKLIDGEDFTPSTNDYDWLGKGIYFWENNPERAMEWAEELKARGKIKTPTIVGVALNLGICLDLLDSSSNRILKIGYQLLSKRFGDEQMPENTGLGNSTDLLLRRLDCSVIDTVKTVAIQMGTPYDSVRGMFQEGKAVYPGAGFHEKDHIQICVCNPNCIKGVFWPRAEHGEYRIP